MEKFSLEDYLKNPTRPIVTRDGNSVRIICTDRDYKEYPIVALVQICGEERVCGYTEDGVYLGDIECSRDLFFAPRPKTKKVLWMNIYKDADGDIASGDFYETEEEAFENRSTGLIYLGTSKIEWEE